MLRAFERDGIQQRLSSHGFRRVPIEPLTFHTRKVLIKALLLLAKSPGSKHGLSKPRIPNRTSGIPHQESRVEALLLLTRRSGSKPGLAPQSIQNQIPDFPHRGSRSTLFFSTPRVPDRSCFPHQGPQTESPDFPHQESRIGTRPFQTKAPGSKPSSRSRDTLQNIKASDSEGGDMYRGAKGRQEYRKTFPQLDSQTSLPWYKSRCFLFGKCEGATGGQPMHPTR
jgi:hypothetical protein